MRYRILGPVAASDGDDPITLASARQRVALAVLLVHAGHVVSVDRLAEELWGDDLPADPVGSVRTQISRLRRFLARGDDPITADAGGYRLAIGPGDLDADVFEALLATARDTAPEDPHAALAHLDDALTLWRGNALGDVAERPFAQPVATRLDELHSAAREDRAELLLRVGRIDDAIGDLEQLVAEVPMREGPRALLMRALYARGRHVDALDAYQRFRTHLAEELGLEPSPALRALEQEILEHSVAPARDATASASTRPAAPTSTESAADVPCAAPAAVVLPVTTFVGRDDVLATIAALLARTRLVTLTGPGGVGKTRLAMHAAAALAGGFRDGAAFCDLGPVADTDGVERSIAHAVAASARPGITLREAIAESLAARDLLLVVDNCEHVLEPVAVLLETLLPRSPDVRMIATSRERLAVDGEQVLPVPPLAVGGSEYAPAVQLFVDRARAADPQFTLRDDDRAVVTRLCRRLDGLPLAIELAASQVGTLGLAEIVSGLDARFDLLTGGRRANPRHRSLRAAIDWSYEQLDEHERCVFSCCSVFARDFSIDDVRAIAAPDLDDAPVAPLLARLTERSLVVTSAGDGGTRRYRLLESLRAYCTERVIELGRLEELRDRHADHVLGIAEAAADAMVGPADTEANDRLDAQFDELRACERRLAERGDVVGRLRLAAAMNRYGLRRLRTEVYAWATAALDDARHHPDADSLREHAAWPDACASAAIRAWLHGDLDAAEAAARAGAESAHASTHAFEVLGDVLLFRGLLDESQAQFRRAIERARADATPAVVGLNLVNCSLPLGYAGDVDGAIAMLAEAAPLIDQHCGDSPRAYASYCAGEVRLESDPSGALPHLARALELAEAARDHFTWGVAAVTDGSLRTRLGDIPGAIRRYTELVERWWGARVWVQQWTTLRTLVELLLAAGEDRDAATLHGAVGSTAPNAVFGADAPRAERIVAELTARLGADGFRACSEAGERLSGEEAVALARQALARLAAVH